MKTTFKRSLESQNNVIRAIVTVIENEKKLYSIKSKIWRLNTPQGMQHANIDAENIILDLII